MSDQQPDYFEQAGEAIGQAGGAAAGAAIDGALDIGTDGLATVLDPAIEAGATAAGGFLGGDLAQGAESLWDYVTGSPDDQSGSS